MMAYTMWTAAFRDIELMDFVAKLKCLVFYTKEGLERVLVVAPLMMIGVSYYSYFYILLLPIANISIILIVHMLKSNDHI